jgi:hypothetical protein
MAQKDPRQHYAGDCSVCAMACPRYAPRRAREGGPGQLVVGLTRLDRGGSHGKMPAHTFIADA